MQCFLDELIARYPQMTPIRPAMTRAVETVIAGFEADRTLFCCGNGGSGADADHIAGELLKGFLLRRELPDAEQRQLTDAFGEDGRALGNKLQRGLRCISLLSHPGFLTAFCNDVDADLMYAQQLYALARPGDVLLGISTSGNARNIGQAMRVAQMRGVRTILLTGAKPGSCVPLADVVVAVPETETFKIQELHLPFYHMLCMAVEAHFFGRKES